jgi:regulator of replication initiation timing
MGDQVEVIIDDMQKAILTLRKLREEVHAMNAKLQELAAENLVLSVEFKKLSESK